MATFLQIQQRILAIEGNREANNSALIADLKLDINETYQEFHTDILSYWAIVTASIASTNSGADLELPANADAVVAILDSAGEPLEARDRIRQINYATEIENRAVNTYALDRFDATLNKIILSLVPATTGTFTVRHTITPADLAGDADVPLGPAIMAQYLIWRTSFLRLMADEERAHLMRAAERRSDKLRNTIAARSARFLRENFRTLTVARR